LGRAAQGFSGAQSLPRVITPATGPAGEALLSFTPLPELATLHVAGTRVAGNATVSAGRATVLAGLGNETGLFHHAKYVATLATTHANSIAVCLNCGANGQGVEAVIALTPQTAGKATGAATPPKVTASLAGHASELVLPLPAGGAKAGVVAVPFELFADGALAELFVLGAAFAHASGSVGAAGVQLTSAGGDIEVGYELWRMNASVF